MQKEYFHNLDGLRTLAAFSVFFYHVTLWFEFSKNDFYDFLIKFISFNGKGGEYGVVFFFILSGFLISYLLFKEYDKNKRIDILAFYIRRVLRIWPLYFATLIIGFFIYPFLTNGSGYTEQASFLMYLFFLTNFDHIYNGLPTLGILGVQWSVAIEEQFYLVWPLFVRFFLIKKFFPLVLFVLIIISELYVLSCKNWIDSYFNFISALRYLVSGALLGYYSFFRIQTVKLFLNKISKYLNIIIYAICLLVLFFQNVVLEYFSLFKYINHALPTIFFSYIIIEQNFSCTSFFKMKNFILISKLGKISYGLYLLHMVSIYMVNEIFNLSVDLVLIKIALSFIITILLSGFSYYYYEIYFLKLKEKFSK